MTQAKVIIMKMMKCQVKSNWLGWLAGVNGLFLSQTSIFHCFVTSEIQYNSVNIIFTVRRRLFYALMRIMKVEIEQ
jgi:hypothetical protein